MPTHTKTIRSGYSCFEKVDANAAKEYLRMHECRKYVYRYLGALLSYIDMMDEIDGGNYRNASVKIDEVVTEALTIAKARQSRKETKEKTDTAGTGK